MARGDTPPPSPIDAAIAAAIERSLGGGDKKVTPPPDRTAFNPDTGNVEYQQFNPVTNSWDWTGIVASRPPAGPSAPNVSVITPAQQVTLANPGATASVTEDELLANGFKKERPGYYTAMVNGIRVAYEARRSPDGKIGFDDVTQRDFKILNPTADPAAATKVSPAVTAANQLVETQRILQGGAPKEGAPAETTSQSPQAPVPSGNYDPTAMGGGSQWASTSQPIRGPVSALGQPGEAVGVNIPTPGGSRMYTVEQAMQDLRAAGIVPTGSREQILAAGSGINAKRANMLAEPGADPLSVQTQLDALNRGSDVYSRAKAVAAEEATAQAAISGGRLPAFGTDTLTAANLRDYITPQPTPEVPQFAEGGSLTVGTEDPPIPAMRNSSPPRMSSDGQTMTRTINGQLMAMPTTGGDWTPFDRYSMQGLFERYKQEPWGGMQPTAGSVLQDDWQHWLPIWARRQAPQFRNMPGGGAWNWNGTDAPTASIGGKTYRFANGGDMMLDEPVVGMGLFSNDPKFLAGEAGPEHLQFTPANQMQAPVPQGNTDPRIMSLFAQTAAQRMRPRVPIP